MQIHCLDGNRFGTQANDNFFMPESKWETIKEEPNAIGKIASYFVNKHYLLQVPRIKELKRYYNNDNNIHYMKPKESNRADFRIASGFVKYITDLNVGYAVGNPLRFQPNTAEDETNAEMDKYKEAINKFNSISDESYHEKIMKHNTTLLGRGYELEYVVQDTNQPRIIPLDPENTFVVYDTTVEQHSLFAVYYYAVDYLDEETWYAVVYTADKIYNYNLNGAPGGEFELTNQEEHFFDGVPITEFVNNQQRMGLAEPKLDDIDGIDLSKSEMLNAQVDYANAIMQVDGGIDDNANEDRTRPVQLETESDEAFEKRVREYERDIHDHSETRTLDVDIKDRVMVTRPMQVTQPDGSITFYPTTVKYITKDLNIDAYTAYVDSLARDIHKDTNTPDMSDENFAGNVSGEAMKYKLWGSDQERSIAESLYKRGVMRRLRLLANYLYFKGTINDVEIVEELDVIFTPNLPKNDAEIIANAVQLSSAGESHQTVRDYLQPVTGVDSETEGKRLDSEDEQDEPDNLGQAFDAKLKDAQLKVGNGDGNEPKNTDN